MSAGRQFRLPRIVKPTSTIRPHSMADLERQVWVGNIHGFYTMQDVRAAVFDNKYALPCHVKLEWGPHDSKYAILTFRTQGQAAQLRKLEGVHDALIWERGRYAVIK